MNKGLSMTIAALAVAVGTYFALGFIFPQQHASVRVDNNAEALDRVFSSGELKETAPDAVADAPSVEDQQALESSEALSAAAAEAAVDEATVAEDVAQEASVEAETVAEPEVPAPVDTEPSAAAPVEEAPISEPAPAQTPKAPAAPKASKPASPSAEKSASPAPTWWGQTAPGELGLVYAGSAAYARAIVLMFDGDFANANAAGKQIRVTDTAGKTVSGSWTVNDKNARMLVFKIEQPGTYRVSLNAALSDRGGRKLSRNLQGPVTVQ